VDIFADEKIPNLASQSLIYDLSLVCHCGYESTRCKVGTLSIEDSIAERESYVVAVFSERFQDLESREFVISSGFSTMEQWFETVIPRISKLYSAVFYLHPIPGSDLMTVVGCPLCNFPLRKSWGKNFGNPNSIR